MPEPTFFGFLTLGGLGVGIFFSISGYLVSQSYLRSENYLAYLGKRCRRIFPGLAVSSFILVYPVAAFYYQDNLIDYLTAKETLRNLLSMIGFQPIDIPQIFSGYKFSGPPNGALWTLPIEFLCYIILATALALSTNWKAPAALLCLMVMGGVFIDPATKTSFSWLSISLQWLLQFSLCFLLGALLAMTKNTWNRRKEKTTLFLIAVFCLFLFKGKPEIVVMGYLAITLCTVIIGTSFRDRLIKSRFDYSYGIYIYTWPVQQIVINETHLPYYPTLLLTLGIVLVLAGLSWHLVESPFLRRRA
jgi:peptidoglycan/LPS O-acetylase OafA/YrhL